jgi:hypothetical protein
VGGAGHVRIRSGPVDDAATIVSAIAWAVAAIAALGAVTVAVNEARKSWLERRLERVMAAVRLVGDLQGQMPQSSQAAFVRFPPALAEVGAGVRAVAASLRTVGAGWTHGRHSGADRGRPRRGQSGTGANLSRPPESTSRSSGRTCVYVSAVTVERPLSDELADFRP